MPWSETDQAGLQDRLGHRFADPALLARALTHRSQAATPADSNERLEFLGDRVLGLLIADLLCTRFADETEGALAKRLVALVRAETLADVAREIDLGEALRIDRGGEEQGARDNPTLLSDACEAVIAALYLDGGLEAARGFVLRYWDKRLAAIDEPPKDAKTALQEWAQGRGLPLPVYEITDRGGPDHAPVFTVRVSVRGLDPATAEGPSKRVAEQKAAARLLDGLSGR